jgi:tetratricopeptide (TPR) repeat protein
MKRKVAEGDRNFTALSAKSQYLPSFLKKIFYLYQAFAKFSLSHYPEAIECYELANKEQPLDLFAKFNKQLAQGIVEIGKKNYEKGFQQFDQAEKTISLANMNKIDPFLYRAAAHIQYAKDLIVSKSDLVTFIYNLGRTKIFVINIRRVKIIG